MKGRIEGRKLIVSSIVRERASIRRRELAEYIEQFLVMAKGTEWRKIDIFASPRRAQRKSLSHEN